ncbi:MAG: DNA topoisomerase IV subunit A [Alphaproteobacteria bacterium]|jgi:topoisomerase-4 subunit A
MSENEQIKETKMAEALGERYLAYALSTIVSRSLPDVRDGLKPVHRRLLYAMSLLRLDPESGFKKCARVVGDVIGKYHPHGDTAVYEAMVRLAQDFAVRYPLVEGQGNFGNIDGDNAAAMRYTEARLTSVAQAIMENLNDGTVEFRPTYSGEEEEPIVMPSAFPNLLANGSSGIAVGMATNIPPHNVGELADALLLLIKKPDSEVADLLKFVQGPDFPTGGQLVESPENILKAYQTGRGPMRLRARWEKEQLSHGLYQIIVTEIPYQVKKSELITRIAKLLLEKKLPLLADVRDESAENVRIVLEPRNRTVDADQLMAHLFRQTDLQVNFNLNMNVLDKDGVPRVMNLKEVLQAFLQHRQEVLIRRSRNRLDKINHRMEVLEGFLTAYLNLDEVIRIIRDEDEPKPVLMKRFKLTDVQAEAILNMRLRSLRKLEEMQIRGEHDKLGEEKAGLEALLEDEGLRWKAISDEISQMKQKFGARTSLGKRRTLVAGTPEIVEVPLEAMIEREPITVILSEKGWIRALKGHVDLNEDIKFKEGDTLRFGMHVQTTDKILLLASNGRVYTLMADKLPRGRGFGEPLRLSIDLPEEDDIVSMTVFRPGEKRLIVSKRGKGFVVKEDDLVAQTKNGKIILKLSEGDKAHFCLPYEGDTVAVIGENRKLLIFDIREIPEMSRGQGVFMQKYKEEGCGISDIKLFKKEDGLSYPCGNGTRVETNLVGWMGHRAQVGKFPPVGFPKSNKF